MDPGLAALLGALIGGIVGGGASFLVTWYNLKKQVERDIWTKKVSRLDQADAKLFQPFLEYAYRLDTKHDVNDLNGILGALRKGRACFTYCPKDLRQKLLELYSILEKRIMEREEGWKKEDIDSIAADIKQIETLIYDAFSSMGL
ncbi:hypothetical protein ES703_36006 [subsurface metagenome]